MSERGPVIQSYSGRFVHLLDPSPDEVCLADVAQGLSMKARFTGQTKFHYSVAQHCIIGAELLERTHGYMEALAFLLHELGEVYLPDLASPIKPHIKWRKPGCTIDRPWAELEHLHSLAIIQALGLPFSILDYIYGRDVKDLDRAILMAEAPVVLGELLPGWGHRGVIPANVGISEWDTYTTPGVFLMYYGYLVCKLCFRNM